MMRGLAERGAADVINRLACGVFGLEVSKYGYPNPQIHVECSRQPVPRIGGIPIGPRMPPWVCTVEIGESLVQVAVRGKTKGGALGRMIEVLEGMGKKP